MEKMNNKYYEPQGYVMKYIDQRLDNFNVKDNRTFSNIYFQNVDSFQENGPIYLYIGLVLPTPRNLPNLIFGKLATETHGAVIIPELRYHGSSRPLNTSDVKNLKYLTSQQVLADLANLIKTIKSQPTFKSSKVVAMGGSYGGGLAAEMRIKYPDVVDCAWVSSAPVLAKKDYYEVLEQVGKNFLTYGGKECYDKIVQIFKEYHDKFQSPEGIKQLKTEFNICESTDMTKPLNQANFYASRTWSRFIFSGAYSDPNVIPAICYRMINPKDDEVKNNCVDYELNNYFKRVAYDTKIWNYQLCTEYGYFKTTNSNDQPFGKGIPTEFFTSLCTVLMGQDFNESTLDKSVAYHNKYYGGLTPKLTKAIFLNHVHDPWRVLAVTKSLSDDAPAVMIEGSWHMQDLYVQDPDESKSLTKAREYAEKLVKYWVGLGPRPDPYNSTIVIEQDSI
ncbi:hypothetical protein O0L34_g11858 [Tuta absoluta]|nr:hypothetical protein O0L34_g11858 [Tuta absoluta]